MTEQLSFHEYAQLFPMLPLEELDTLADDIKINGLLEAITICDGEILDGRNRYVACKSAAVEPRFEQYAGDDPLGFVISKNLHRRHMSESQRAVVAAKMANMKRGGDRPSQRDSTFDSASLPNRNEISQADAADMMNVSPRSIRNVNAVERGAPDLLPQIESGEMTVNKATQTMRKRQRAEAPPMPTDKYRVLYADPPWFYAQVIEKYGPAERHYQTMKTPDICAMGDKVKDITTSDAVLFLWSTSPKLKDALDVAGAWGFRYTGAMFVWDKIKHNYGHYNSVRHELLLICTRGSCTPDVSKLYDSVQTIERAGHSEKPEEFRVIIDAIYPNGKRIELFARRPSPGWDVWGNEV